MELILIEKAAAEGAEHFKLQQQVISDWETNAEIAPPMEEEEQNKNEDIMRVIER
jgi:hypothetical protein